MMIVAGHGYAAFALEELPFYGIRQGAIGVEFFFMLSGFLLARNIFEKHYESNESYDELGSATVKYVFAKFKRVFPTHALVFLILFVERGLHKGFTYLLVKDFIFSLPELCLIQMSGLQTGINANPYTWYISSMLLAMMLIYPLCRRYRGLFSKVIAPCMTLVVLGYLFQTTGTLTPSGTVMFGGVFLKGTLRAIAEIALGTSLYEVYSLLNTIDLKKWEVYLLRILEIGCYVSTLAVSCTNICESWYFIFLFVLALGLVITFSKYSVFKLLPRFHFLFYLGDLSMTIFLCQRVILYPMKIVGIRWESYWLNMFILMIATLFLAMGIKLFVERTNVGAYKKSGF